MVICSLYVLNAELLICILNYCRKIFIYFYIYWELQLKRWKVVDLVVNSNFLCTKTIVTFPLFQLGNNSCIWLFNNVVATPDWLLLACTTWDLKYTKQGNKIGQITWDCMFDWEVRIIRETNVKIIYICNP